MLKKTVIHLVVGILLAGWMGSVNVYAEKPDARSIMEKSQQAFYYAGRDMKVKAVMELVDKNGKVRRRVLTMLRVNEEKDGRQRFFVYFHEPGDVRRMTFMVWKYPEKEDDRWIFIPAVDLIRRIAAEDKRSSFVGSDFTYEDISGRDLSADEYKFIGEEQLNGRAVYVIDSFPREKTEYSRKRSYIDVKTFIPLKEEYYDAQGNLFRIYTSDEIKGVKAGDRVIPTVVKRTMKDLRTGHQTVVTFESVEYNLGLKPDEFNERHMRRPPRKWIRDE